MNDLHIFFTKWKIIVAIVWFALVTAFFLFYLQGLIAEPSTSHHREWSYIILSAFFACIIFYNFCVTLSLLSKGKVALIIDERGIMVSSLSLFIEWNELVGCEVYSLKSMRYNLLFFKPAYQGIFLYLNPDSQFVKKPQSFLLKCRFLIESFFGKKPSIIIGTEFYNLPSDLKTFTEELNSRIVVYKKQIRD